MKKFLVLPLLFLMSVSTVFAQEVDPATDNVAGIPIPAGGLPNKQEVNIQAHLKAEASTTFGADLDTGYTGFQNSAKATIELEFVNHDAFAWSNGQQGDGVENANKGIRGGITVEDFKLSNGDGLALSGTDAVVSQAFYQPGENPSSGVPMGQWHIVPVNVASGSSSWTDINGLAPGGTKDFTYNIEWRKEPIGQQYLSDPNNQTFNVSYGDIVAYLYVHDFYMKVSTNPSIKANNTLRYWSAPINGVTNSYYGQTVGWFFGEDNLVGRRFYNSFGGLTIGYQKDNVFNVHGEIASMSHFNRNDKTNLDWGMNWINAYAYKLATKGWLTPDLTLAVNMTGSFGQKEWLSAPVGQDSTHGLSPMVWDGRDNLLNMKGTNGAYTVGGELAYKNDFGWTNGHRMEFILGVDSMIDPFASQKTLYGTGYGATSSALDGTQGMNSILAVAGAVRYQWPITEGVYEMASGDTANRAFYLDDGEDRTSGLTFGVSYARALGFDHNNKNAEFKNFYEDGANALNFNFTVFEDEENGLVPGLGFVFGIEVNDILRYGRELDTTTGTLSKKRSALNLATQGELSYAFQGTWLSPKGRIIPYVGAWYSPNAYGTLATNQYFSQDFEQRLYTKVGLLFKQVIPFTEIGVKWESNNVLAKKDKWGAISTTLKIIYE